MLVDDDGSSKGKDWFKKYLLSSYYDLLCAGYGEAMVLPSRSFRHGQSLRGESACWLLQTLKIHPETPSHARSLRQRVACWPTPFHQRRLTVLDIMRSPGDIFSAFLPSTWTWLHGCKHFHTVELSQTMLFPRFQTWITLVAMKVALSRALGDVDGTIWW